jgi:hypothetical protein
MLVMANCNLLRARTSIDRLSFEKKFAGTAVAMVIEAGD